MDRNAVIELALKAGVERPFGDEIVRFADLVAAHEREECAKVCEAQTQPIVDFPDDVRNAWDAAVCVCALSVRERGKK